MRRIKLILLCLMAGVVVMSCKKEEKTAEPNAPVTTNYKEEDDYNETLLNLNLDMVYVQGGTFEMGALECDQIAEYDQPVHYVTLSSYHISRYEITQAQYKMIMGKNPSWFEGDNLPVEKVTWFEAKEFCDKLSKKTGKKYALPTEAQWEFAARGGNKSKGYMYSGSNDRDEAAWHGSNSDRTTHAVGTKIANELGIYDMSGNVEEMCADWYGPYSDAVVKNPTGPISGTSRVWRGGCFLGDNGCHVSCRNGNSPNIDCYYVGFRVVCIP